MLQRKEIQCGSLSEASALLAAVVLAATAVGKKGSVTLKLEVEPKDDALNFSVKLTSAMPTKRQPLCIFYADEDGGLHRDDPAQRELELTAHDGGLEGDGEQKKKGDQAHAG